LVPLLVPVLLELLPQAATVIAASAATNMGARRAKA
jgi:hypothetical protein